jgi:hypothetical protein
MWIELDMRNSGKVLLKADQITAIYKYDSETTAIVAGGQHFRVTQDVPAIRKALNPPAFTTPNGEPIQINMALVRSISPYEDELHYQLKFNDDGFLEVYSDVPIKL